MKRKKSLSVIERNRPVLSLIQSIKAEHPFWGYRRCWAYLYYRQGLMVNKKRIYRLMKEHGLLVTKINKYRAKRKISRPKPKAYYPNHIWGTDMTKIKIGSWGWYYLVIVLDWYIPHLHRIPDPMDQLRRADGAVCVVRLVPGHVPYVDVLEPLPKSDVPGDLEPLEGCRGQVPEPVLRVKSGEVDRDGRPEVVADPTAHRRQGFGVVVLARDQERGYLQMDPLLPEDSERAEYGRKRTVGHVAVVLLREALEIDVGRVQVLTEFPEGRRLDEAVGVIDVPEAASVRELRAVQHVLVEDRRLRIGIRDRRTAAPDGGLHELFRWEVVIGQLLGTRLGDVPVLAELAVEVAAGRRYRERRGRG